MLSHYTLTTAEVAALDDEPLHYAVNRSAYVVQRFEGGPSLSHLPSAQATEILRSPGAVIFEQLKNDPPTLFSKGFFKNSHTGFLVVCYNWKNVTFLVDLLGTPLIETSKKHLGSGMPQ